MATGLCTVCGRALRAGACPEGHPQRAARARRTRRWPKRLILVALVLGLLGAGAYAGLVWYPQRAAESAMEPASSDYAEALGSYREVVDAFPQAGELSAAEPLLEVADAARTRITEARIALEGRTVASIPVVSDQPPLRLSEQARDGMILFYSESLGLIGDMEAAAGFLSDAAAVLPSLENLRAALTVPRSQAEAAQVAAAARPIAEQLGADTRSLSPPDEMAGVHASLLAIAGRIRADVDELEPAAQAGVQQVLTALVNGIREQIATYESTVNEAPALGLEEGLDERIAQVDAQADAVTGILRRLEDVGVDVTVPDGSG